MNQKAMSDSHKLFIKALIAVFILKLFLAVWIPFTGDEAYFVVWGKNPDFGFYDHPPLAGWILSLFLIVSDAAWWLRMPAVVLPVILAYSIYRILLIRVPEQAPWVALAFLMAPPNIINVLFTTDTPLIFFSFLSAWYFYKSLYERQSLKNYFLCGLFLGLAFFSKYFAVLLGISFGLYILIFARTRRNFAGLLLIFLLTMVFAGINIYWNYTHCWNNILFNLYNRTAATDDTLQSFINYIIMMVYLFTPVLIYYLVKNRELVTQTWKDNFNKLFLWIILVPYLLFILVLFRKEVGLHWLLSFYPFVFIAIAGVLTVKQWKYVFHFMWVFSVIHIIVLGALLILPAQTFKEKYEAPQNLTMGKYPDEVFSFMQDYQEGYHFATISYGTSAMASYHTRKHFMVFSSGSYHAREDDRLTDFSKLDGKNIVIFKKSNKNIEKQRKYFDSSERKTFFVKGTSFELLIGKGFKYSLYYEDILKSVNKQFYQVPDWMPIGQCDFKEKYNFD